MTSSPGLDSVSITRWYRSAPDLVFRAFTEPALLERWFCPDPELRLRVEHLDLRVGGRFRFVYHFPDRPIAVIGIYRVIDRPRELVFTWTWEPPDPHAGIDTLVRITFSGRERGTDVAVLHENFPDVESLQRHRGGWQQTLERLANEGLFV